MQLPEYIKISDSPFLNTEYEIVKKVNDKYILVNKNYKYQKLKDYALILFIWEGVLIISLILIFYITLLKYIKKEHFLKKYLEIMLLTITHKLGNFLAVQKLNLELIKSKCNIRSVQRLEKAYKLMEKDFKLSVKILKNISNEKVETVNIKKEIVKILNLFNEILREKNLKLSLNDIYIKANQNDIENILFTLIENAIKFSKKNIYIKTCHKKDKVCIIIKNDIGSVEADKGTGVGLKIVQFLIKKYKGNLYIRANKYFLTIVCLKK